MGNKQDMKKKIKQALISVSDKSNLKPILKILKEYNIQIISSGGTYKEIIKMGYNCIEVSEFTNSPEILGGRILEIVGSSSKGEVLIGVLVGGSSALFWGK